MAGPGFDTVIVGAGIAGVALADALSRQPSPGRILLLDRALPLSQTTAKSGENFRAAWPQPCMAALADASIGLMRALAEDTGNAFSLKFSGYEYLSEQAESRMLDAVPGLREVPRDQRPWLAPDVRRVLRDDRAGAFDVHALGSVLLKRARGGGVALRRAEVARIDRKAGGYSVRMRDGGSEETTGCSRLVLAAGPHTPALASMLGIEMPVRHYLQRKVALPDPLDIVPRDMPFTIFADAQKLPWSDEEAAGLADDPDLAWLLEEFPGGVHIKPEAGGRFKMGWAINREAEQPRDEPQGDAVFAELLLRGACHILPGLAAYVEQVPPPVTAWAGYYSRTPENWPLVGPLAEGLFTVSALAGFGTMTAMACGGLCAAWMEGDELPTHARHFSPGRYSDPDIVAEIAALDLDGQL